SRAFDVRRGESDTRGSPLRGATQGSPMTGTSNGRVALQCLLRQSARLAAILSALVSFAIAAAAHGAPTQQATSTPRALPTQLGGAWTGDFDGMVERRVIRVLVPYSRTLYFNDKGRERGISADFVRDFERYINQKYAKQLGKRPLTVVIR